MKISNIFSNKSRLKITALSTMIVLFLVNMMLPVQAAKKSKVRMNLAYYKYSDDTKAISAKLTTKIDRKTVPVEGVSVNFFIGHDLTELLGDVPTNDKGEAVINIPKDIELEKDSAGNFTFMAVFDGDETYRSISREIEVKDVQMKQTFFQKDTVKSILVTASEVGVDGEEIPLDEIDIIFYAPRTFSLLKVAEGWMQNGECTVVFPTDLPGDLKGNLTIIAKIEENDLYGNVETKETIDWGKPLTLILEKHRGLGDVDAPLWMVYTLIILMSGVWGHFFYIFYLVYSIKKESKKRSMIKS